MIRFWQARQSRKSSAKGFTLVELLIVLSMIGILFAIAAPAWQAFMNNQRLNTAQNQIFSILKQAQKTGILKRIDYQASFRQSTSGKRIEWAIHPATTDVIANPNQLSWQQLDEGVQIDNLTTFYKKQGIYRMQFNHEGAVNGQLGQMVLSISSSGSKRCVAVSSLLGAMRTGEFDSKKKTCNTK
jgi:prepilin-type N-terminal cleavage/methylation domain-containing protein